MSIPRIIVKRRGFLKSLVILLTALFSQGARSQSSLQFYQLTMADGLSDNYIGSMLIDKSGNLWIGTGEGINVFNGKTVVRYFNEEYPQLQNNSIRDLKCDDKNRIWALTQYGNVTLIDENRRFHRIALYSEDGFDKTRWVLQTKEHGEILYLRKGRFIRLIPQKNILKEDSLTHDFFSPIQVPGSDSVLDTPNVETERYDDNSYIFNSKNGFFKIDFKDRKVGKKFHYPDLDILTKWGDDELLVTNKTTFRLQSINLITGEVTYPFDGIKDQFGKTLNTRITRVTKISDKLFVLSSSRDGLYLFDLATRKLYNYKHNPADPTTIISNTIGVVATDNSGWVFLATAPQGISYFKSNAVIGQQSIFIDKQGNGYDGYVNSITSLDNDTYYIGGLGSLLEWKRSTNTTRFIPYAFENGKPLTYNNNVTCVTFDPLKRLWVAVQDKGIYILDNNKKPVRHITKEVPSSEITQLKMQPDGFMWISTINGIFRVNIRSFEVDDFKQTPLKVLNNVDCWQTYFADHDNIWISSAYKGLWHYQPSLKRVTNFTTKDGLPNNQVHCVVKDSFNNVYVGANDGLSIFFSNGRIKTFTRDNQLVGEGIKSLVVDKSNRIWIGNSVGISCFNIKDSSIRFFDERYGLSLEGVRIGAHYQKPDGELIWGTYKGLQYFYPDELMKQTISIPTLINRVETRSVVMSLTQSKSLDLSPLDNYVTFHFGSIDYSKHLHTYYQYKLEGLDKEWVSALDQNFVKYSSLSPGKYTFKVRASNDSRQWKESENQVSINIAAPFYGTLWFKIAVLLLCGLMIIYVLNYYRKKQRRKQEELEAQVVINYFASQINRHLKTEDIIWDVAKNCISKLNFEDCVIYLVDEERNVLVQKAAWGPKLAKDFMIHQPIEIPVGQGIVGSVAQSAKAELIPNTELDKRYIADDAKRFSELTVPLIINNKVIGVIDSEHSRKNFFTKRHLNILSTVAVLCATQIERAKAEQEEQEAQLVINYFASQIHSRYKTEDLLWDVAKNLIGKMGFEDCMIYLWNDDKTVLVQKAGYGSKGSMESVIDRTPYHIPRGKGIVGAAVESKMSLLINDTSKDGRYFTADDKTMLSELCVPLVHDNEVLGAINIEHHQKNFFTSKHLKMLSTIAALCANQLQLIRAEEEKQQAVIEALQNKQKATETRLQSLRLQMNPHFLFNALNSIQQMILSNEELVATRYLSRFSKLLRTILVHSDKEMVTLKEEIDILKLYVELESIRFKDSFDYEIIYDDVEIEEIKVPTLLIQPFVENAIWHGLMHKDGSRNLKVEFTENHDFIKCIIEDNGIGRNNARELKIKSGKDKKHTSRGIQVSEERLRAMQYNGVAGSIKIHDLVDVSGKPLGTQVEINFPIKSS